MIDNPQPFLVVAFAALLGATVAAFTRKISKDQETVAKAAEIVGTNATLQRAVKALQDCNNGLEDELAQLKERFAEAQVKAASDLAAALLRVDELERIVGDMTTVRDIKQRRVARANEDIS
jgi:predicted  nucleic acid-binding Zn-ribbon protein